MYRPNVIASCEFKPFWFKNQAQLSTHLWRTCVQRMFQVFLQFQLMVTTIYMLAEIVGNSFTARGDPSESCSWTSLPCCDLKPFSRVKSRLENKYFFQESRNGKVEKTDSRSAEYPLTTTPQTTLRTAPRTTLWTTPRTTTRTTPWTTPTHNPK